MSDRTNLNKVESPMKYIFGSMVLLALSGIGMFWLTEQSKKAIENQESVVILEPTKTILPTISEDNNEASGTAEIITTPSETLSPTPKEFEKFESTIDRFGVTYKGNRKMYEENEISGKRYVFFSPSGNITVHVGKTWSWINSGREFSDSLLIGGEKSYVYEITNQKIVDIEKNDKKYSIQCVHNALSEIKEECDKFLSDFYFL